MSAKPQLSEGSVMHFSKEWDKKYLDNTHISVWPWSDLVSYFNRYAKPFSDKTKVLEIGFGAGANIPFFKSIGVDYAGIDGSATAHKNISSMYPELSEKIYLGDFIEYRFPDKYDVIVDRASMTHNSTDSIIKGLKNLAQKTNKGGLYLGIDWFSTEHSDYLIGSAIDKFTRSDILDGQFAGVGAVHFSTKEHITELFNNAGFDVLRIEHKTSETELPKNTGKFASYNLVARLR